MILREKDKQILLAIFSSLDYPVEVLAYGSRVNGSAHSASDLDLAVRGKNEHAIPLDIYSMLLKKIQESNIPFLVDIRDFYTLPDKFQKNIESNYELFYKSP